MRSEALKAVDDDGLLRCNTVSIYRQNDGRKIGSHFELPSIRRNRHWQTLPEVHNVLQPEDQHQYSVTGSNTGQELRTCLFVHPGQSLPYFSMQITSDNQESTVCLLLHILENICFY